MILNKYQQDWINALKSGEFKQGCGSLCNENLEYCCLGVYCEVLIKHGIDIKKKIWDYNDGDLQLIDFKGDTVKNSNILFQFEDDREEEYPPESLEDLMDLYHISGTIHHTDESKQEFNYDSLAEANDEGRSFEEIAEFIEKYPQTVFKGN